MGELQCASYKQRNKFLIMLQISDSVFPTGGFTHSLGCESSLQRSHITNMDNLRKFMLCSLENMGSNSLPYVKTSYLRCHNLKEIQAFDLHYGITHSNHVANRSSKQQGRSFLHAASATYNIPALKLAEELINENKMEGYHEIIFGMVCGMLEITLECTLEMYLFGVLRTMVNSMVRLGKILGPMLGQTLQNDIQECLANIIERNYNRSISQVCNKFPIPDLMQSSHDSLFSRLFYS